MKIDLIMDLIIYLVLTLIALLTLLFLTLPALVALKYIVSFCLGFFGTRLLILLVRKL